MSSVLTNIIQECADEVAALEWFEDITVLTEDIGDLQNEVTKALGVMNVAGGKVGTFVLFVFESARLERQTDFGPVFGGIKLSARVIEEPTLNRGDAGTGKITRETAEKLAAALSLFTPASGNGPVLLEDPAIEPIAFLLPSQPDPMPGHEVRFTVPGSLAIVKTKCVAPAAVNNAGLWTMTCDTPGAAIFYTTDGKNPRPGHALYTEPVALPGGATLKMRAWLAGFLTSAIVTVQA